MHSASAGAGIRAGILRPSKYLPQTHHNGGEDISPNSVVFSSKGNFSSVLPPKNRNILSSEDAKLPRVTSTKKVTFSEVVICHLVTNYIVKPAVKPDYAVFDKKLDVILAGSKRDTAKLRADVDTALVPYDQLPNVSLGEVIKLLALQLGKAVALTTAVYVAGLLLNRAKK